MKRVLFVHCCYTEHLIWIFPIIKLLLEKGISCHLYPTHWDSSSLDIIKPILNNPNFKLIQPINSFSAVVKKFRNRLLKIIPLQRREKQIAIESYKEPAHRFLGKGEKIPEGAYGPRIFDIVRCNKRYTYDALIAHGIHANVISSFAWHYLDCLKWVCDRGFIKGSVMFDKYSTETDDSELQHIQIPQKPLSESSKRLVNGLEQPLIENQTSRDFKKPEKGKNLLYALSRIRNEVNIKGCMKGLTELEVIKSLSKNLPPDWNLIVKVRGKYKLILGEETLPENVYVAPGNTDINYLIDMSDAVISFISKMGLEAGLKEKVILTMGAAHYSHLGFSRDLQHANQIKEILEIGPMSKVEKKNLDSFLENYIQEYLVFPDRVQNPQLEKILTQLNPDFLT